MYGGVVDVRDQDARWHHWDTCWRPVTLMRGGAMNAHDRDARWQLVTWKRGGVVDGRDGNVCRNVLSTNDLRIMFAKR